jgi:crossover junction endodeoxyribonuclease RuvC
MFLLLLYDMEVPTVIVPPTSLKKYATGNGSASKERMVKAAQKEFTSSVTSDDIADALWLAHLAEGVGAEPPRTRKQLEVIHGIRNPKTKRSVGSNRATNV